MHALVHAVSSFFDHLGAVEWRFLAVAALCHAARGIPVSRAWRNALAYAYPQQSVRWRDVLLGYLAGAGINAVIPARVGDAVKLYVLRHRIAESTYPTLASSLVVLNVFDFACGLALFVWALAAGFLPSLDLLPHLPDFDFSWFFEHRAWTIAIIIVILLGLLAAGVWAWERVVGFKRRVATGFAVLRHGRAYLRRVAAWQALDWALRLVAVYWFLRAFGVHASVGNALRVQVTQSLSTLFPFSPSGIGTEQALALYVLAGQAAHSAVLAFSVGMHLTLMVVNVVLGAVAIAVAFRTLHIGRAAADARRSRGEVPA